MGDTDCTLHKSVVTGNEDNTYGQNFEAKFCRCHRLYDAKSERETMVQCVVCEDWYHESCLNLRTRPNERAPTPDPAANELDDVADGDSNASNDLPPPLLPSSTYDSLICGACVLGNETLRRWAGTVGAMMVVTEADEKQAIQVEDGGVDPRWKVLKGDHDETEVVAASEMPDLKRGCDIDDHDGSQNEERATKKPRTENYSAIMASLSAVSQIPHTDPIMPCLAPPINSAAQQVLSRLHDRVSLGPVPGEAASGLFGEGDIFLTEGWRERWCRCPKVTPHGSLTIRH